MNEQKPRKLSKRVWTEAQTYGRKIWETEKALHVLAGKMPCPRCDGKLVYKWSAEFPVDGRYYHFKRACRYCSMTETPGYFTPQEVQDYGIRREFK